MRSIGQTAALLNYIDIDTVWWKVEDIQKRHPDLKSHFVLADIFEAGIKYIDQYVEEQTSKGASDGSQTR